jgi:hypothetical protein
VSYAGEFCGRVVGVGCVVWRLASYHTFLWCLCYERDAAAYAMRAAASMRLGKRCTYAHIGLLCGFVVAIGCQFVLRGEKNLWFVL